MLLEERLNFNTKLKPCQWHQTLFYTRNLLAQHIWSRAGCWHHLPEPLKNTEKSGWNDPGQRALSEVTGLARTPKKTPSHKHCLQTYLKLKKQHDCHLTKFLHIHCKKNSILAPILLMLKVNAKELLAIRGKAGPISKTSNSIRKNCAYNTRL